MSDHVVGSTGDAGRLLQRGVGLGGAAAGHGADISHCGLGADVGNSGQRWGEGVGVGP